MTRLTTVTGWLDKFDQGTLTDTNIQHLCQGFETINECGALFSYMQISKDNNRYKQIEETNKLLDAKEFMDNNHDDVALNHHFYLRIGSYYYVYGINLD